jgi:hypothetical protein
MAFWELHSCSVVWFLHIGSFIWNVSQPLHHSDPTLSSRIASVNCHTWFRSSSLYCPLVAIWRSDIWWANWFLDEWKPWQESSRHSLLFFNLYWLSIFLQSEILCFSRTIPRYSTSISSEIFTCQFTEIKVTLTSLGMSVFSLHPSFSQEMHHYCRS